MLKVINGDLLKASETYIAHQVNCKGIMRAGVAKQIKRKYPELFKQYKTVCKKYGKYLLGEITVFDSEPVTVINMFAQNSSSPGKVQTDYKAFQNCLNKIKALLDNEKDSTVAFPYGIGCVLAKGDWTVVSKMIEDTLPTDRVVLYKLSAK